MTQDRDFFTPDNVDEQVDQLSQSTTRGHFPYHRQTGEPPQAAESLIEDLQAYYQTERQEDSASLEYVWKRVSGALPRNRELSQLTTRPLPVQAPKVSQERVPMMRNHVSEIFRGGNFSRRLGLLVAVLVAALVVGSLAAIVTLSHHQSTNSVYSVPTMHVPIATSTPVAASDLAPGKTLYTTPANRWGFEGVSWSPDSKHVASATIDPKGVQFWDATTGKNLVTVQLPGGTSEWAYNVAWSPDSDNVAVATNQHILIVNGQTGKIISSHAPNVQTASTGNTKSSSQILFSRQRPAGEGFGYRATTWSPNGRLMASAYSSGTSGEIEVWNPQANATDFTLTVGSSENIGALSWSSDGKYIAATTWFPQGTDQNQPSGRVMAWNVATHQMVFQHSDFLHESNAPVVWQPGSHNLAFGGATLSGGGNQRSTLEIWNAITGKQVKQLFVGNSALAWSPDGKDIAYASASSNGKNLSSVVIIIDATTGKQIYTYKGHNQIVSVIAWSPDGRYIASAEGNSDSNMVAKVWTA